MSDDPGGVFASDEHRRALAFIADSHAVTGWRDGPRRNQPDGLALALSRDEHTRGEFTAEDVEEILKDLEADGDAKQRDGVWSRTAHGTKRLGE